VSVTVSGRESLGCPGLLKMVLVDFGTSLGRMIDLGVRGDANADRPTRGPTHAIMADATGPEPPEDVRNVVMKIAQFVAKNGVRRWRRALLWVFRWACAIRGTLQAVV
jgi:hypothetical protein